MRMFEWANGTSVSVPSGGIAEVMVVGTTFEGRQVHLKDVRLGDQVEIHVAIDNPHDDKAVEVHHNGNHVGHVPSKTGLAAYICDGIISGDLSIQFGVVTAILGGYEGKNLGLRIYLFDDHGRRLEAEMPKR
jgi:hypothetical protein